MGPSWGRAHRINLRRLLFLWMIKLDRFYCNIDKQCPASYNPLIDYSTLAQEDLHIYTYIYRYMNVWMIKSSHCRKMEIPHYKVIEE